MSRLHRERGAALLIVLWVVALLAALIGAFALTARIEALQSTTSVRGLAATEAARAGIEYAITRVSDPDPARRWRPDGRAYRWELPQADGSTASIELRITDEQGKVDLNAADASLLEALLRAGGAEQGQAAAIAGAIIDWRDPDPLNQPSGGAEDPDYAEAGLPHGAADAPFGGVAELLQVLGMTPDLFGRIAGALTVHSGRAVPELSFAPALVLQAMGQDADAVVATREAWDPAAGGPPPELPGGQGFVGENSGTYSIRSIARIPGRAAAVEVVARQGGSGLKGSAWTPLRWEEGVAPR